jgi:hypothetical protein
MFNFDHVRRPTQPESASSSLENRAEELRASLRLLDPELAAARSGISYRSLRPDRGELRCPLWGKRIAISWPDLTASNETGDKLPAFIQALLLYYLNTADGIPVLGTWVSFADLPDGRMYNKAFQGYTGDEIVKTFGLDLDAFKSACESNGGEPVDIGDASFMFMALPRVPILVTYWLGDEEFPSTCKILFDSSATHYLPIDGCAIVGSALAKRLKK